MTLAEKLAQILQIKGRLLTAIGEKDVSISAATPFSAYPDRIRAISTGGVGYTLRAAYNQCNTAVSMTVCHPAVTFTAAEEKET